MGTATRSGRSPTEAAVLIFPLAEDRVFSGFEAVFEDSEGHIAQRRSDLVRNEEGLITLGVFRDFLEPGRYEVILRGFEDGNEPRVLDRYPLDWQLDESPP